MLVGVALAIRAPAHRWQALSCSPSTLHDGGSPSSQHTASDAGGSSIADSDDNISLHEDEVHRIRMVPCIDTTRDGGPHFDVIERELTSGTSLELGRFTDQLYIPHRISFRTKVVSRKHAVLWVQRGKLFIRDTKSSSGTYVNNIRLSAPYKESKAHQLHDGDVLQLGADYRGGAQDSFRCIRLRLELNRKSTHEVDWFSYRSFHSLQQLTSHTPSTLAMGEHTDTEASRADDALIKDCSICLYAVAPLQALFVAPCQHTFHYKCIRPLLTHYPGFQCPCCRNYSDLESPVAIEKSEVLDMLDKLRDSTQDSR